jgi:Spy/CpxP family protein refolding chaperone
MNTTLKKVLLAAASATVSLATLSSASWSMNHGMGMEHDSGRMLSHMAERLDLSQEQREQVKSLLAAAQETTAADRERLQELRQGLHDQGADVDEGQAQAAADEIGQITSRLVYQATITQARVQMLLTPEQRAEMARLMEKRAERRGKWHRGGGVSRDD